MGKTLLERCKVNTNLEEDRFVGIKMQDDDIYVHFPLGFSLENDEKEVRKDILLLMNTLRSCSKNRDSAIDSKGREEDVSFPIQDYLFIIGDYYRRGIYKERETVNVVAKRGKVNWSKTIKTQQAYLQDDDALYLDFVVKKQNTNTNELITLIHEYCVYDSFSKVGWIFSSFMPPKPRLDVTKKIKYYESIVKERLLSTNNDMNKQLFNSMLRILESLSTHDKKKDFVYGTDRFEYIWETMVDKLYGIPNKEDYYPNTRWILQSGKKENSPQRPDTIMLTNEKNKVYILDSKYYKYGQSANESDLPGTTSINKQIDYGEYVATDDKFKINENNPKVYNAFIMPYNSQDNQFSTKDKLHYVGTAISDRKGYGETYQEVIGILLDVKTLMQDYSHSNKAIVELAKLIEANIKLREKK